MIDFRPILAVKRWRDNADMIADVYRLGYIEGQVYDATPGDAGALWWRDIPHVESTAITHLGGVVLHHPWVVLNDEKLDFTKMPFANGEFDTVAYDPPYKLNGNPDGLPELSSRYGVEVPTRPGDRILLLVNGLKECARISSKWLLVKCQDQVCNGHVYWQTDILTEAARRCGFTKVDRFDLIGHSIPQPMGKSKRYPNGRKQRHAWGRGSTLLVFKRVKRD